MNVLDGERQPFLRDTVWDGKPQKLVTSSGIQKGSQLKSLLEERGVIATGLKKEDMIKIVEDMRDFKFQKIKVEELILNKGHRAIPKFHCELNLIERVWCHAKQYTRSHCDYSFSN